MTASTAATHEPSRPAEFVIRRVGVVGLGHMGHAFAVNLVEDGYQVSVHDRDPKRIAALTDARAAPQLADLAACDIVVTSLPDDDALAAVALGPEGLAGILAPNAVHISTSTVSPPLSRRVAEEHARHRQDYVAAPVLGNPDFARARKLFVLAAGPPSVLEKVRPLLQRLGQRLFLIGEDAGLANLVKLAANVLTATTLQCMGEVLALLRKGGVDGHLAFDVLTSSLFDSRVHKTYGEKIVDAHYSPPGLTAPLAVKDLRLALAEAERAGVPMPAASLVHDRLVAMVARGWAGLDWSALGLLAAVDAGLNNGVVEGAQQKETKEMPERHPEEIIMEGSKEQYVDKPRQSSPAGLIIRQKEPTNLEMPFDQVDSYLTPTELFYIRSHFPAPRIDAASYQLRIDGAVRNPLTLSYKELREMPSETRTATLECAGNGRVFLVPQVRGAQWELGAVGNAEWTGVPLRALLERAGLEGDACEVVLEGADRGIPTEEPIPPGPISYARSVPREKAVQPEVLIAYQMNGRDLSRDHGYPVRAIVPGHYGMASVKWLTRVQAVREPFQGYWQTSDYGYWDFLDGKPVRRPLAEMKLKSAIARPRVYETLSPNQTYTVFGAAWTGETEATEIAVSTDGGQTWAEAHFLDPARRHAWRRWQFDWLAPKQPGQYTLLARAKDASGGVQPNEHDPNYGTYIINHPLPIEVIVEDPVHRER